LTDTGRYIGEFNVVFVGCGGDDASDWDVATVTSAAARTSADTTAAVSFPREFMGVTVAPLAVGGPEHRPCDTDFHVAPPA
jgi:hypothetical protein